MTDADCADNLELLANTPTQAKFLLHCLEQAAGGIIFYVNANKTLMSLTQGGSISTLSAKPLKFVDKFTYLGSNISSIQSDVNIRLAKAWTTVGRLSIIWKYDLSDEIKLDCVSTNVWMYHLDANGTHREKASWELWKNATKQFEQIQEAAPDKIAIVRPLTSHKTKYPRKTKKTSWSLL